MLSEKSTSGLCARRPNPASGRDAPVNFTLCPARRLARADASMRKRTPAHDSNGPIAAYRHTSAFHALRVARNAVEQLR